MIGRAAAPQSHVGEDDSDVRITIRQIFEDGGRYFLSIATVRSLLSGPWFPQFVLAFCLSTFCHLRDEK